MNPNRLTRELRDLPENTHSDKLPGGSLVSAVLDRKLMAWSDRGGASRVFGEVWSEFTWHRLRESSTRLPEPLRVSRDGVVLRLDANPRIAAQAGRNKLPNPDFLLIDPAGDGSLRIRAIDAKFAVDRVRRIQIDPESTRTLIELPGSLTRTFIAQDSGFDINGGVTYEHGAFLAPCTILNEFYHRAHTAGRDATIPASELLLMDVTEPELFGCVPERELMLRLRSLDQLHELTDASDIVAGMYYLRLAYAARWFEEQLRLPLLSLGQAHPVEPEEILSAATPRLQSSDTAYQAIQRWSRAVSEAEARQFRVRDAARLPLRMAEIRDLLSSAELEEDKKYVRIVRGRLERQFMQRLIEEIGEVPASPTVSMSSLVARIRKTSRGLRPEMWKQAIVIVDELRAERQHTRSGDSYRLAQSDAASWS